MSNDHGQISRSWEVTVIPRYAGAKPVLVNGLPENRTLAVGDSYELECEQAIKEAAYPVHITWMSGDPTEHIEVLQSCTAGGQCELGENTSAYFVDNAWVIFFIISI